VFPITTTFEFGLLAGDLHRRLDPLPVQQRLGDALRDDALEIGDALRLDALALRLLTLLLQHEVHALRVLLGLLLGLDGRLERRRQPDVAEQHVLDDDAAGLRRPSHLGEHLLRDPVAPFAVECARGVGGGDRPHDRPHVRNDEHVQVVAANRLEDVGRTLRVEPVQERGLEVHEQPLARGHLGHLLGLLRADGKRSDLLERVDEVEALGQLFAGHAAEQRQDPDVSGFHRRNCARPQCDGRDENDDARRAAGDPAADLLDHLEPVVCHWLLLRPKLLLDAMESAPAGDSITRRAAPE